MSEIFAPFINFEPPGAVEQGTLLIKDIKNLFHIKG